MFTRFPGLIAFLKDITTEATALLNIVDSLGGVKVVAQAVLGDVARTIEGVLSPEAIAGEGTAISDRTFGTSAENRQALGSSFAQTILNSILTTSKEQLAETKKLTDKTADNTGVVGTTVTSVVPLGA